MAFSVFSSNLEKIFLAGIFIVSRLRDGAGGATGDALSAFSFYVKQAIVVVMLIFSYGRRDHNFGNQRSAAHGLAFLRNQAVTQTEGAEPGDKSGVTLGPVGSESIFF